MAILKITGLEKSFSGTVAIRGVGLEVQLGEVVVLLGPSGCGKTTTLRCVAGLESPTAGEIWIGGCPVYSKDSSIPAEDRQVGMVFQSYALWPHLTVYENVVFGLRLRKWPQQAIDDEAKRVLGMVGLWELRERSPSQLSGGQQQRVALARSLVGEPKLLLFDEPLSNLDARLRERMRSELRALVKSVGITALYVTHDQAEALAIADRVAVMDGGRIAEIGAPQQIYDSPRSRVAAEFLGAVNVLPGEIAGRVVSAAGGNGAAKLLVRAENILVSTSSTPGSIPGKVARAEFLDPYTAYEVNVAGAVLLVHGQRLAHVGDEVFLTIPPDCLRRLDSE